MGLWMLTDQGDDSTEEVGGPNREAKSRGGRTRAERLTPEQRSDIARQGAVARWGDTSPIAPHHGELRIGGRSFQCAVLADGTRIINQSTMAIAFDRQGGARRGAGSRGLPLISAMNLQTFVSLELRTLAEQPIRYTGPGSRKNLGYAAEIVPMICEVYLEAREAGALRKNQLPIAQAAEVLARGLARVGIVALVDEATGYQETRARNELQLILETYVASELRPWIKMFPDDFFKEIYRLQGWEYRPGTSKRTPYVGILVNKYIYNELPPGVLSELQRLNPRQASGHRRAKHHQLLTEHTGNVHLDRQISTVTTLMRIARNKAEFEDLFERAFPPAQQRLPLIVAVD